MCHNENLIFVRVSRTLYTTDGRDNEARSVPTSKFGKCLPFQTRRPSYQYLVAQVTVGIRRRKVMEKSTMQIP